MEGHLIDPPAARGHMQMQIAAALVLQDRQKTFISGRIWCMNPQQDSAIGDLLMDAFCVMPAEGPGKDQPDTTPQGCASSGGRDNGNKGGATGCGDCGCSHACDEGRPANERGQPFGSGGACNK